MTHSVQYDLTSELSALFQQQLTGEGGPLAAIKIAIDFDAENFALASTVPLGGDVSSDFTKVKAMLEEEAGCYIVFRMLRGGENAPWALMSFVPDDAPVKQKMLYSSAKDALRKKLGQDSFTQEFHWSHLAATAWCHREVARPRARGRPPPTPWRVARLRGPLRTLRQQGTRVRSASFRES